MKRSEILKQYEVNEHNIIKSPGKFEGEMIYAPHFYDLYLDGCGHDEWDDNDTDFFLTFFDINDYDRKEFPELKGIEKVSLWEDDLGFIYIDTYKEINSNV